MEYKDEMRKLIDIVKNASLEQPLESTLDDLLTLTSAAKDLTDRIETRVRKNLVANDKPKGKGASVKKKAKQLPKPPLPSSANTPKQNNNSLPTTNPVSSTAISQADYNKAADTYKAQQKSLKPITPQAPIA